MGVSGVEKDASRRLGSVANRFRPHLMYTHSERQRLARLAQW